MLIREGPATELAVAIRILAHRGSLAPDGHVAVLVGSEVVYLPARGTRPATVTPFDMAAVRLGDGLDLAGTPPDDAERYLRALRADPGARAVALAPDGRLVTAAELSALVERLVGLPWPAAEVAARAAGALVGVYPGG